MTKYFSEVKFTKKRLLSFSQLNERRKSKSLMSRKFKITIMKNVKYRIGKWLPSDSAFLNKWIDSKVKQVNRIKINLLPLIVEDSI